MANSIEYDIKSDVVDIRMYKPCSDGKFFVDTNVWFWTTYDKANESAFEYQVDFYPRFVNSSIDNSFHLYHIGLTLSEIAYLVEKTEREIFCRSNKTKYNTKYFRHNFPLERQRICLDIDSAWSTIENVSNLIPLNINQASVDFAIETNKRTMLDGYDLFILQAMKQNGIEYIVTDDGDFTSVEGITVVTANSNILQIAHSQNRLITIT